MKTNYYLIDTENVGDRWMDFIDEMQEEDVLVVFYSRNHSKMLEETYLKQRYNKKIRWIECLTGSNALDHQLMGVLSYLVATYTDATYSICSNDKDYQNVIDFWEQRGWRSVLWDSTPAERAAGGTRSSLQRSSPDRAREESLYQKEQPEMNMGFPSGCWKEDRETVRAGRERPWTKWSKTVRSAR